MYILGCDPGLDGAFVILNDGVTDVKIMPTRKRMMSSKTIDEIALKEFVQYFTTFKDIKVVMEKLSNTGGRTGSFAFGDGYGLVRGMLIYAGLPVHYVRPQQWKKDIMPGMPADKIASCVVAARLYPEIKPYMTKPRGGLHDGVGDALCIAEWGKRNLK